MRRFLFLMLLAFMPSALFAQVRTELLLDKGWKFTKGDNAVYSEPGYDDSGWHDVVVPHDWAIYGPFGSENDRQNTAILQDGQTEAMMHDGRTGGLPFVGVGWYRIPLDFTDNRSIGNCNIVFDGAMSHAKVYVNGKEVIFWPYGYNSFHVDITPYVKAGAVNELAVRLENYPSSSRWYPGAGLYRNVHVIITEDAHVPVWGTRVVTSELGAGYADIDLETELVVPEGKRFSDYRIETEIIGPDGKVAAEGGCSGSEYSAARFDQSFKVINPKLWTPDSPHLYKSVSRIYEGNTLKDEYETVFGIRTVKVEGGKGFFLNGEPLKFKGVCNHHDLGPLGAAVNEAALRRQVRILKDMGSNAIRTAHNMPAPELVRICDEMGMMVMAESFDEWDRAKVSNGYARHFREWAEKDMVNLVRQFRNSASVVMWCIGNEVPDQGDPMSGPKIAYWLQSICHREDPTRPVTQGMDQVDAVITNNLAAALDVPGFNYRNHKYQEAYARLPQRMVLGTETASTVSSRGVYKFPVERASMKIYPDHQASGYDLEYCSWSNLPEDDFIQHEDLPYCMGEFVWTGFDYLGEPTPYYAHWPSHSSLFGIIDLAGLPKDRYWLYRSHWNKEVETLHILPHWNWEGREGEVTPVFVYTNHPSAELFINGKSQGRRTKDLSVTVHNSADSLSLATLKRQKRYRLMWMDTVYEPGTVKVVAYDKDGNAVAEKEMHTAGKPYRIVLEPDRDHIKADGKDLSFVTVKVVDKDGNLCPVADNEIFFKVKGQGTYRAGANGNAASLEPFQRPQMKVFYGMMTAIVSSTEEAGEIVLEATSKGLRKAEIVISTAK